jgi:hypothetical protein
MTRMPWLLSILTVMGIGVLQAASLQKGQMLYEHRLFEEAKHALVDVVMGDTSDTEKAGALYLLGSIGVEQKNYPIAARMWSDLIQRYPESTEATEARSRLSRIPNGVQYSKVRVESPEGYGSAPSESFQGVMVTGTSADAQYAGKVVSEVVGLLDAKGVTVARDRAPPPGTISTLVLSMQFGRKDSLQAACYSREGQLLWTEKASGFLRLGKASATEGLVNEIKTKIEPHIGDRCLPKT